MPKDRPDRLPFGLNQRVTLKLTGQPAQVIAFSRYARYPTIFQCEFVTGHGDIATEWFLPEQLDKPAQPAKTRKPRKQPAAA